MMEADVVMRACDPKEPIMAHPPAQDSDITLREWLQQVKDQQKGIKLDFKRLNAAVHTHTAGPLLTNFICSRSHFVT